MPVLKEFDLTDQVALITGGAQGLGLAMATGLAEAGAHVAIGDINTQGVLDTAVILRSSGYDALGLTLDVTKQANIDQAVSEVLRVHGRIDILVNNAGITGDGDYCPEDLDGRIWDRILAVNLTGQFLCAQTVGKVMMRQGGGKIINIASMSGLIVNRVPDRHSVAYCVSKAGVIMLTKVLAVEWVRHNIRVNAIAPTYFDTSILNPDPKVQAKRIEDIPMGRLGEPAELAGTVVYLASNASSFVTGHTLLVDGGYTAW